MKLRSAAVFFLIFLLSAGAFCGDLRIVLNSASLTSVTVRANDEFAVFVPGVFIPLTDTYRFTVKGGGIIVNGTECSGPVTVQPPTKEDFLRLDLSKGQEHIYRGALEVSKNGNLLRVVNVVNIEEYLLGVLPCEMSTGYPVEALKAQAVAARTWSVANMNRHGKEGCNLCDGTHCQAYKGVNIESPDTSLAVWNTAGKVLLHGGKIASAMYCADCGGESQDYRLISQTAPEYLKGGVEEPAEVPHILWSHRVALSEASAKLIAAKLIDTPLTDVSLAEKTKGGRVNALSLITETGITLVRCDRFRTALGTYNLKTNLFTVALEGDDLVFTGKGSGHGAGMGQIGCKYLAGKMGMSHDKILLFYYPGVTLGQLEP
ncbi:MAG: SpoIID/LytB domain-containing protein [Abditibacteriota bacterium]|nr:SpoIID/LytB domain-containing protein [Abditibacteriota bacterium]